MKILLGCGDEYREGWVHVDREQREQVDVVWDLDQAPWPFGSNVAERIEAVDVLEHLHDTVVFMDECWRILAPGGLLLVQAVGWQSENLWRDPTHRRGFHPDTLRYLDPDSPWHRFGKLYTTRTWRVLWVRETNGNVITELEPRK